MTVGHQEVIAIYSAASEWSDCIVGQLILANNSYLDTGIEALRIDKGAMNYDNAIYDLQGRRVSAPQRGFYIKNGKKYFGHTL